MKSSLKNWAPILSLPILAKLCRMTVQDSRSCITRNYYSIRKELPPNAVISILRRQLLHSYSLQDTMYFFVQVKEIRHFPA